MKNNERYRFLLKSKRKELNLTQYQVSEKIKISRSYYSDIENGRTFPSGKMMLRINEVLPIFLFINDAKRDFKEATK
ncbi:helix-turn-helix transcriptional regulator [Staphylococcus saprophyticus]|uniref:helix-turn-helix domain-containing protein n=1 Tax=Staphylococcus saprophyticus TaxID=29385 RepID=UPI0022EA5A3A|nr:helix-turn-helix transcriptional regulator [Staphylococcus saprophyticus]MDW3954639.1 helix-turn-helix transcriptional regulator [Staphylococcus saprophyticus]MDW4022313.1 helix-turn-helix transcriptional regulator [Staphylococcus saprophyticus]